jgi:uncharacterized protein YbaA (DUF1428 family)
MSTSSRKRRAGRKSTFCVRRAVCPVAHLGEQALDGDPRMADMMNPVSMAFDGQRMFWGGFETLVET